MFTGKLNKLKVGIIMKEKIGYKTKSLTILNIVFIVMLLLTLGLLILVKIIDLSKPSGIILALIFIVWIYLPIKEIKQDKNRYEVVLEMDKNIIQFRDLKNEVKTIKNQEITKVKVSKVPFIKFGSITFYTQLEKVTCRYIKEVALVAKEINVRLNN